MTEERDITLTAENFDSVLASEGKILVDFWAPWCGPCRHQSMILDTIVKDGLLPEGAKIARVNVDEQTDLADRFEVSTIPTLILFQNGQVLERFTGLQNGTTLIPRLK